MSRLRNFLFSSCLGQIISLLTIGGLLALVFIFWLYWVNSVSTKEDTFCTVDDEVYRVIEAQHEEWIEYYRTRLNSTGFASPELIFKVESGSGYSINASVWRSATDVPRFFVVTESGWQENFGVKGYFFSPAGKPLVVRLRFQHLDGDVYCYWFE
ncbi:MAG: hypothetical protein K8L99_31450 [Anaerolineae bacterium]|nr:hypothetical protein [Anaerolineae bacterium]